MSLARSPTLQYKTPSHLSIKMFYLIFFILISVFIANFHHGNAYACSYPTANCGYFSNQSTAATGDQVFACGGLNGVTTAAAFKNEIDEWSNGTNINYGACPSNNPGFYKTLYITGADYVMCTMTTFDTSTNCEGSNHNSTDIANAKVWFDTLMSFFATNADVDGLSFSVGLITLGQPSMTTFTGQNLNYFCNNNTLYQIAYNDVAVFADDASSCSTQVDGQAAIVFKVTNDSNGTFHFYTVKEDCGNPIGQLVAFPPETYSGSPTVTLHGTVSYNTGAPISGVVIQACDCAGNCGSDDGDATKGDGTTGSTGQYSLIVYEDAPTCINVVSGEPPGSPTLNNDGQHNYVGSEYEIIPVTSNTPTSGWGFTYPTTCSGSCCSGSCCTSSCGPPPTPIVGDCNSLSSTFNTAPQAPSPSVTVTWQDTYYNGGSGTVSVGADVSPNTSTEDDQQYEPMDVSPTQPLDSNGNPIPLDTPYFAPGDSEHYVIILANGSQYDILHFEIEYTSWNYTVSVPTDAQFSINTMSVSDNVGGEGSNVPNCDPSAPSLTNQSFSCGVGSQLGNVTFSAGDADGSLPTDSVTYSVDGGSSQDANSNGDGTYTIDMSGYDQLQEHSVSITVGDVNILDGVAPSGEGQMPASSAVDYPQCYIPTCGNANYSTIVENQQNSSYTFQASVQLGFTPTQTSDEPSKPSTINGTLTDAYDGIPGYNYLTPPGNTNTSYISDTMEIPANITGNYLFTWTFTDGPNPPIDLNNCQQQNIPNVTIAYEPYLRVYGGDVKAGLGTNSSDSCIQNSAAIATWNEDATGNYSGSGTQLAALATGNILGFVTGDGASAGLIPSGLSFANNSVSGDQYGGLFNGNLNDNLPCDYYAANVSSSAVSYQCNSSITINNGQIPGSPACSASSGATYNISSVSNPTVVKVNGNVTITGTGPGVNSSEPWVNSTKIPNTPPPTYKQVPINSNFWTNWAVSGSTSQISNQASEQLTTGDVHVSGYDGTYDGRGCENEAHGCAGAIFNDQAINTQASNLVSFTVTFNANFTAPYVERPTAADGIALELADASVNNPDSANVLGDAGCGIGAGGIPSSPGYNSLMVYLDTYDNGYYFNYGSSNYWGVADSNNYVPTCGEYPIREDPINGYLLEQQSNGVPVSVTYCRVASPANGCPTADQLRVTIAGQGDPTTVINNPGLAPNIYVGFTAGSGGAAQTHTVTDPNISEIISVPGTTTYTYLTNTDSLNVPSLYVVAKGNIYIAPPPSGTNPPATNLYGVYVAEQNASTTGGTIYTCNDGTGADATNLQTYYASCDSQLILNGALVANSVQFERTFGTANAGNYNNAGDTAANPSTGWNNAAEVINYNPADWLSNPFTSAQTPYDAISSLPPVL